MNHNQLKEKALKKQAVRKEYEALEPEFKLLREMLEACNTAESSQAEPTERIESKSSEITRVESAFIS